MERKVNNREKGDGKMGRRERDWGMGKLEKGRG